MQLRSAGRLKGNEKNVDGRKGFEGGEEYEKAAWKMDGLICTRVCKVYEVGDEGIMELANPSPN